MLTLQENETGQLRLYSIDGRIQEQFILVEGTNHLSFKDSPAGLYIYRVYVNGAFKDHGKLVIVK